MKYDKGTWLQSEEYAYPNGGETRKGSAVYPDGKVRRVYAGIPDTVWTIPANGRIGGKYVRGYVSIETESDGEAVWLAFQPESGTVLSGS